MKMSMFHMYVASCVPDGGIYHYICKNGEIQLRSKTAADRPMYLTLADNRLYAVLREPFADSPNSGVCYWEVDAEGNLHDQSEIVSTGGRCGCHLTVHDGHVYVANYLSGSLCMLPEGKVVTHSGKGPNPLRQEAPHVHFVGFTPDEKWLLAVDLGVDAIFMYSPDLQTVKRVDTPSGHGCRHLAWSEDGQYCFCANELESTVSVLRYEQDVLTLMDTVSVLPENWQGENTAAAIRVVGERIYVSLRGCDQVAMLDYRNGAFTKPRFVDVEGSCPRDIHICADVLFSTNETSDSVTVFQLEKDGMRYTGKKLSVPSPLCVIFAEE